MVQAIMKDGNLVGVKSKLGVAVMAHHPNFKQFKKGAFLSVSKALKLVDMYNEQVIVIGG